MSRTKIAYNIQDYHTCNDDDGCRNCHGNFVGAIVSHSLSDHCDVIDTNEVHNYLSSGQTSSSALLHL